MTSASSREPTARKQAEVNVVRNRHKGRHTFVVTMVTEQHRRHFAAFVDKLGCLLCLCMLAVNQSVSQSLIFKIVKIENCLHLSSAPYYISPVVSSYQHHSTWERFHLHPELVDKSGDVSTVLLCHHCVDKSMPPRMSIANNIDFGLLSRIDFRLETTSALETMLMSKV